MYRRWDITNPTLLREERLASIRAQINVTPEIMASQLAYQGRPFAVGWRESHFSGTFRFDTLAEALSFVDEKWARVRGTVGSQRYASSDVWGSYVETPSERLAVAYYLLASDVSSY